MKSQTALSVREVADLLSVDSKTVYRLVQRSELPGFKVAGSWRFLKRDIDTWIEKQKSAPRALRGDE
jgi:excisionase family DNA binding protein